MLLMPLLVLMKLSASDTVPSLMLRSVPSRCLYATLLIYSTPPSLGSLATQGMSLITVP